MPYGFSGPGDIFITVINLHLKTKSLNPSARSLNFKLCQQQHTSAEPAMNLR